MIEGQQLGHYVLRRLIGSGGMGRVYEAVHRSIGRRVAIKVLHPEGARSPRMIARFLQEARAASRIQHPGVVLVLDYANPGDGVPYLVMEFVEGELLADRIRAQRQLDLKEALAITRQIAEVLSAAHAQQVIHRDLKPDNIMLVPAKPSSGGAIPDNPEGAFGAVKILDFGIAAIRDQGDSPRNRLTGTGACLGTPTYMAPEQCRDTKDTGERTDVYSLGVILYEMLAGRPPFVTHSLGEMIAMHLYAPPPPITNYAPAVPESASLLVAQMLAKAPPMRPAVSEVVARLWQLEQTLLAHPARPRPRPRFALAALVGGIAGLIFLMGLAGLRFRRASRRPASTATAPAAPAQAAAVAVPKSPLPVPIRPRVLPTPHEDSGAGSPPHHAGTAPSLRRRKRPSSETHPTVNQNSNSNANASLSGSTKADSGATPQQPTPDQQDPEPAMRPDSATELKPFPISASWSELPHAANSALEVPGSLRVPPELADEHTEPLRPPPPPSTPAERLSQALSLRKSGAFTPAIEQAIKAAPALGLKAWSVAGVIACEAGLRSEVRRAYLHLDGRGRACLREVCAQHGLSYSASGFRAASPRVASDGDRSAADQLIRDARRALDARDYAQAMVLARHAAADRFQDAWQILGRAACQTGALDLASEALCRLEPGRRQSVEYVCSRAQLRAKP